VRISSSVGRAGGIAAGATEVAEHAGLEADRRADDVEGENLGFAEGHDDGPRFRGNAPAPPEPVEERMRALRPIWPKRTGTAGRNVESPTLAAEAAMAAGARGGAALPIIPEG
jgi:hypothetical protein